VSPSDEGAGVGVGLIGVLAGLSGCVRGLVALGEIGLTGLSDDSGLIPGPGSGDVPLWGPASCGLAFCGAPHALNPNNNNNPSFAP
jgi:hypothetical protein